MKYRPHECFFNLIGNHTELMYTFPVSKENTVQKYKIPFYKFIPFLVRPKFRVVFKEFLWSRNYKIFKY